MSHRVDTTSIHRSVFLLLNLCYAAEPFGKAHDLATLDETDSMGGPYYVGWLKFTLSEMLIEIAIKTRIFLDLARSIDAVRSAQPKHQVIDVYELDQSVSEKYNLGFFAGSSETVCIREACNKIIHAIQVLPLLERGDDEHYLDEESDVKREWQYWDGSLELTGTKGQTGWSFTLYVSEFSRALDEFVDTLEKALNVEPAHRASEVF